MFFEAFMFTTTGFVVPEIDPDHPVKVQPLTGVAVSVTFVPAIY